MVMFLELNLPTLILPKPSVCDKISDNILPVKRPIFSQTKNKKKHDCVLLFRRPQILSNIKRNRSSFLKKGSPRFFVFRN